MILFLDFDGVLHPYESVYSGLFPQFLVRKDSLFCHLPRFENVVREHPDIEIVISSDWRFKETLEELKAHFSADIAARIFDTTTLDKRVNYRGDARCLEIYKWLRDNQRTHETWLAVDDMPGTDDARFVVCSSFAGFDAEAAERLEQAIEATHTSKPVHVMDAIEEHREAILELVEQHGFDHARVLGRAAEGIADELDDLSMLVDLAPGREMPAPRSMMDFLNGVGEKDLNDFIRDLEVELSALTGVRVHIDTLHNKSEFVQQRLNNEAVGIGGKGERWAF